MDNRAPFSNKQLQVLYYVKKFDPVITICEGAIRSGKTHCILWPFVQHIRKYKNRGVDFIILGYSIGSVDRNILRPMQDIFQINTHLDTHNQFELFGNRIHCFGSDDTDAYKAMQGMTSYGGLINEWALCHKNSIAEFMARNSGEGARIFGDTNPDHPLHPTKKDFIDHSGELMDNGRVWLKSFHFCLEDNHTLTAEYIDSVKRSIGHGVFYDRKILGKWVAAEGAVYPDFDIDKHTCESFEIPESWERSRSIDLGYNNPFVCGFFARSPDDILYLYDEHYQARMLIKDHVDEINKRPGYFIFTVRDHDAQEGAELEDHGLYTTAAQKEVEAGIQAVGKRLVIQGNGKPRFMIFRNCRHSIEEMLGYVWKPQKDGIPDKEEPLKVNDHCPDMIRYDIMEIDNQGVGYY